MCDLGEQKSRPGCPERLFGFPTAVEGGGEALGSGSLLEAVDRNADAVRDRLEHVAGQLEEHFAVLRGLGDGGVEALLDQLGLQFDELGRRLDRGHFLERGGQFLEALLGVFGIGLAHFLRALGGNLARFDQGFNVALREFGRLRNHFGALFIGALGAGRHVAHQRLDAIGHGFGGLLGFCGDGFGGGHLGFLLRCGCGGLDGDRSGFDCGRLDRGLGLGRFRGGLGHLWCCDGGRGLGRRGGLFRDGLGGGCHRLRLHGGSGLGRDHGIGNLGSLGLGGFSLGCC